jgi:hypothetical protein
MEDWLLKSIVQRCLITFALPQYIAVFLQRTPLQLRLLPQVGGQKSVCVGDSCEGGFECVLKRFSGS